MISSPKALDLLQIGSSMPQFSLVQAADEEAAERLLEELLEAERTACATL